MKMMLRGKEVQVCSTDCTVVYQQFNCSANETSFCEKKQNKKNTQKKNILTLQTLWNSFKKRELWKLWDLGHLYRACHCKVYSLSHSLVFICIKFNMASGLLCNVMCKIYFSWKDHPTNSTKSKVYLYIYYEHKAASHTAQKLAVQLSLTFNDA